MSTSGSSVQFRQLPMFLTPAELGDMESVDTGGKVKNWRKDIRKFEDDRHPNQDPTNYLRRMRYRADKQGGIENPVHGWFSPSKPEPLLADGHHRSSVAMTSKRLVPVVWHDQHDIDALGRSVFLGPTSDRGDRV